MHTLTVRELYQLNDASDDEFIEFFQTKFDNPQTINEYSHHCMTLFTKMFNMHIDMQCKKCGEHHTGKYFLAETYTLPSSMLYSTPRSIIDMVSEQMKTTKDIIVEAQNTAKAIDNVISINYIGHCSMCNQYLYDKRTPVIDINSAIGLFVKPILQKFELNNPTIIAMMCNLGQIYNCSPESFFNLPINAFMKVFEQTQQNCKKK